MNLKDEPTLESIDDYNNQESPQKRKTVRLIIIGLLAISALSYAMLKSYDTMPNDYIGTPQKPGIISTKRF